jgi:cytochrome P450
MHHEVLRLHETYGPIVRLGPSEVSFIDAAAWKDIYSLKRCRQIERCPKSFPALTPHGAQFDLLTYSPSDHGKYRKILNPSFSEKATKEYEPTIHQNMDNMISKLVKSVDDGKSLQNGFNGLPLTWLVMLSGVNHLTVLLKAAAILV